MEEAAATASIAASVAASVAASIAASVAASATDITATMDTTAIHVGTLITSVVPAIHSAISRLHLLLRCSFHGWMWEVLSVKFAREERVFV